MQVIQISDYQDYLNITGKSQFKEYAESGVCPNCSESLERVFDRVSDDPILDECVEVKCTECEWTDNAN
jgi:hypothetical protein